MTKTVIQPDLCDSLQSTSNVRMVLLLSTVFIFCTFNNISLLSFLQMKGYVVMPARLHMNSVMHDLELPNQLQHV